MFDYNRAIRLQRELSKRVLESIRTASFKADSARFVAGVDASYVGNLSIGVAVLLDLDGLKIVGRSYAVVEAPVPYIPGLLAFREAPGIIQALARLGRWPEVIMVDGHGLTHPRGFGIASHIGLVLDTPSIGVAKSRLYGEERVEETGRYIYAHGLRAGAILRRGGFELYVSIGYSVTLEEAVRLVERTLAGHKLPEPVYLADKYSKEVKKGIATGKKK
ncbi:endonuclease V [Thermogladius sp. 4427co]|uniref:endonuclease V n=1 Tax=Thermogladius sp. 4427co TaxID=3450718 RepID=UPI003F78EAF5